MKLLETPKDKSYLDSQPKRDTVALAARILANVRYHIERDHCVCCRQSLCGTDLKELGDDKDE